MTKRAKRLAEFLEQDLGWTVFDDSTECPQCSRTVYGHKYCPDCGTKQGKPKDAKWVIDDLEKAIKHALGT